MPIFDFKCNSCDATKECMCKHDAKQICVECGEDMHKVFSAPHVYHPFREGFYEHIDKKPIYIKSKRQLREECTRRGLSSLYLD